MDLEKQRPRKSQSGGLTQDPASRPAEASGKNCPQRTSRNCHLRRGLTQDHNSFSGSFSQGPKKKSTQGDPEFSESVSCAQTLQACLQFGIPRFSTEATAGYAAPGHLSRHPVIGVMLDTVWHFTGTTRISPPKWGLGSTTHC